MQSAGLEFRKALALGLEEETCPAREAGSSSRRWPEHQGYRLGVGSQPLVIRTVLV